MSDNTEFKFTKTSIDALPAAPFGKRVFYKDAHLPGLQLRVTDKGIKSFFVRKRIRNGADERVTLGRFPAMSVEVARDKASTYLAQLSSGKSVMQIIRAERGELTFAKLFAEYMTRHAKPNKRTWDEDQKKFDQYLQRPLGSKKLSQIDRRDIAAIHSRITVDGHPATANRVLALLSAVFGRAIEWGHWDELNPCRGIRRNREVHRDRFLQSDELPRFFAAVAAEPSTIIRDYLLISLLTGARRSNVVSMRWGEISFARAEWKIERTKNGESQVVTLSPEAMQILKERKEAQQKESMPAKIRNSPFVFYSTGASGHLEEPKMGWTRVKERARALGWVAALADADGWTEDQRADAERVALEGGSAAYEKYFELGERLQLRPEEFALEDLRIHDLRRTLGSWQAKQGTSLTIIGKSLNHKSMATTQIYARLDQDPVRDSVNRANAAIFEAAGVGGRAGDRLSKR